MFFVGREQEIAKVEAALAANKNVVLRGKYGIGRTSLIREVGARNTKRWNVIYADFSERGGNVCASILKQLSGRPDDSMNARQLARALAAYEPKRAKRPVVVLDGIAKLTRPKFNLLRKLRTSSILLFVAVVERFLSDAEVMRLRVALDPAVVVTLDHLDENSSISFFSYHARRLGLPWNESEIELLARAMHGYPLEMAQLIARIQRDRQGKLH